MKTRKKLLIALLSATCLTAGAFGFAACDKETKDPALVGIYNAYVTEANEKNETPLSYEDWLKDKLGSVAEKGEQGKPGDPGANGKSAYELYQEAVYAADPNATPMTQAQWLASLNGITPHVGENGNWYLGDQDTQVKAAGTNGTNGVGVTGITMSEDGKSLVVSFTSGEPATVALPDHVTHKHTYDNEYTVIIPATGEVEGIGYKQCTDNGCDHYELYVIPCYTYKVTVYMSDAWYFEQYNIIPTVAADAKVTLENDKGEKVAEATTDENGDAIFNGIEKGEYSIVVEKEGYISYAEVDKEMAAIMGVTSLKASDYQAMLLGLPASGEGTSETPYQVSNELDYEWIYLKLLDINSNMFVTFTAPKAGHYEFSNSRNRAMTNLATFASQEGFSVTLDEGEKLELSIDMFKETTATYPDLILEVVCHEADRGTESVPVKVDLTEDVTFSAEANEDVYFKLVRKTSDAVRTKITFDEENLTVKDYDGNPVSSGDIIDFGYTYRHEYVISVKAKDGKVAFKTEAYAVDGELAKPIALEGVGSYQFTKDPNSDYATEIWYKLVVAENTTYLFEQTEGMLTFFVYSNVNSEEADFNTQNSKFGYEFKAGTYYLKVASYYDDTFEIKAFNPATDTGLIASYPLTAGAENNAVVGTRYYKYTAENAGYVVISSGVNFVVYKDAAFEEIDFYSYSNKAVQVAAGDSVYFTVTSYSSEDTFSIENVAADAKIDYTVTLTDVMTGNAVAGVTVKLMKDNDEVGSATTNEEGVAAFNNVNAGEYDVVVALTAAQQEDYVLAGSDYSVNLINKDAYVSLKGAVSYEVTLEGLDLLDSTEGLSVVLYSGEYGKLGIDWSVVESVSVTGETVTFSRLLPVANEYKFVLSGLPEEFTAKDVQIYGNDVAWTITITKVRGEGDAQEIEAYNGYFNIISSDSSFKFSCQSGGNYTISVDGGYLDVVSSGYEDEEGLNMTTYVENGETQLGGVIVETDESGKVKSITLSGCYEGDIVEFSVTVVDEDAAVQIAIVESEN